jgi:hypothetical protein
MEKKLVTIALPLDVIEILKQAAAIREITMEQSIVRDLVWLTRQGEEAADAESARVLDLDTETAPDVKDADRDPEKLLQRAMEAIEAAGFHVNRAYEENNRDAGNNSGYQEHLTGAICLRVTPQRRVTC